jgi:hypothetical protein
MIEKRDAEETYLFPPFYSAFSLATLSCNQTLMSAPRSTPIRWRTASMKAPVMTAEVFLTAFRTLPRKEQDVFLSEMLKDRRIREDLIDIAIAGERSGDKAGPFRTPLEERGE